MFGRLEPDNASAIFIQKKQKKKPLPFVYLAPVTGPSPVAPVPPGESRREILRK